MNTNAANRFRVDPDLYPPELLKQWVTDARQKTVALVDDLTGRQMIGPKLDIVNPLLWEIGHVAFFPERFVLRDLAGQAPFAPEVDDLYDSIAIEHHERWDLPLMSRDRTMAYLEDVRQRTLNMIDSGLDEHAAYRVILSVLHEDMHTEAFTYMRQTLAYPAPCFVGPRAACEPATQPETAEVEFAGGRFVMGSGDPGSFAFDNEFAAHEIRVAPFAIDGRAVSQGRFVEFLDDGGYAKRELWSEAGWSWRGTAEAHHPVYWRREGGGNWSRRVFDGWVPVEPELAMIHVNWHEADAFCTWAGRRLPTEVEWEFAARHTTDLNRDANLDWSRNGCVAVDHGSGCGDGHDRADPARCRHLLGNAWEWTSTRFAPYDGFEPGPYREYSAPLFGSTYVLRGGSWATRSRLAGATYRNYYGPERRDVWAGFRTCRNRE